jgi:hypothetical protein
MLGVNYYGSVYVIVGNQQLCEGVTSGAARRVAAVSNERKLNFLTRGTATNRTMKNPRQHILAGAA